VRRRVHHHGSVYTSTTNAPIKNTKGGDSLKCNLSSANRIKNIIGFASLAMNNRDWNHKPSITQGVLSLVMTLRVPTGRRTVAYGCVGIALPGI